MKLVLEREELSRIVVEYLRLNGVLDKKEAASIEWNCDMRSLWCEVSTKRIK